MILPLQASTEPTALETFRGTPATEHERTVDRLRGGDTIEVEDIVMNDSQ